MSRPTRCHWITVTLGLTMGFTLSRLGFSDYERVQAMFTFAEFDLTLAFATAVVIAALGFRLAAAPGRHPQRRIHKGTLTGGILFGTGWALCGACPSIALVQLGEGRGLAVVTLAGVLLGTGLYSPVHRRFFRWPLESCSG